MALMLLEAALAPHEITTPATKAEVAETEMRLEDAERTLQRSEKDTSSRSGSADEVASPTYEGSGAPPAGTSRLRRLQRELETAFVEPPTVARAQKIASLQAEIRRLEDRERGRSHE